ncbi:MAG: alpha-L-fucosidase [Bacteroidetes bacterium]|nr:alpha-L-fucosidase [Bacteroidota bacterium]
MRQHIHRIIILALFLAITYPGISQENTNERALWFTDARFGMFIHWGVYSGAEGIWKEEKLRNDNDYAEWIYYRNRIGREEYLGLLDRFNWEKIDPEDWVLLAKEAGMKYVTITAKHHDGFALWDSKVSDYDVTGYSGRDIIAELADACRKHGLKLGLYYSHWVDWEHPHGWDHSREIYGIEAADYDRYWQEKVIPQMKELLTSYGDVGLIWFDMWIHHSKSCVSREQLMQLKSLIRELQPECLVNSRLGLSIEEDSDIDFKTLGDNQLGSKKEEFPWQSPATVAHSWGFHALEEQYKSTTTLLHSLISNVSLNGNFMLNIGPRANGDVPYEISHRLQEMGTWLHKNGESIYGSQAFDLRKDQHSWGKITSRRMSDGRTRLYLHLFNWPLCGKLPVSGILARPEKAFLLADSEQDALNFTHKEAFTLIELPEFSPDPRVSVVVLEYDHYPEIMEGLVSKSVHGAYSLTPLNMTAFSGSSIISPSGRRGTTPAHIDVKSKSSYSWRIYVDRPGKLKADVSYSFRGTDGAGSISIMAAGQKLSGEIRNTGQTVGEPNSNWWIESFESHGLGTLEFESAGFYDISLTINPGKVEAPAFQWLWIGE